MILQCCPQCGATAEPDDDSIVRTVRHTLPDGDSLVVYRCLKCGHESESLDGFRPYPAQTERSFLPREPRIRIVGNMPYIESIIARTEHHIDNGMSDFSALVHACDEMTRVPELAPQFNRRPQDVREDERRSPEEPQG